MRDSIQIYVILALIGVLIWLASGSEDLSANLGIEREAKSSQPATEHSEKATEAASNPTLDLPKNKPGTPEPSRSQQLKNGSEAQKAKTHEVELPPVKRQSGVGGILSEHFRSHPSTEERMWHLRDLGRGKTRQPVENVDQIIDVKNRLTGVASEIFSIAVGPLTLEDEWKVGREVHGEMLEKFEVDVEASERLKKLAEPFLGERLRTKNLPFTFTVVKDDTVNAFAHLGGHVYFFTGLLDEMTRDEEVQFVLAHEIAHVELMHCSKRSLALIKAKRMFGDFAQFPAGLFQSLTRINYQSRDELDADAWAYKRLKSFGQTEKQIFSFFYRMLDIEESKKQNKSEFR